MQTVPAIILVRFDFIDLPLRWTEAVTLTWDKVRLDDERGYIRFDAGESKSGWPRVVPLYYPHLRQMLIELPSRFHGGRVFLYNGRPFQSIQTGFKTVLEATGIRDVRIHDRKHCAVTHLLRAGVPQHEVEHVADHNSPLVRKRYTTLDEEHIIGRPAEIYDSATGLITQNRPGHHTGHQGVK